MNSQEKRQELFNMVARRDNWKLPTKPYAARTEKEAKEMAEAITWFVGGAEIEKRQTYYLVKSKGYYHYIGA